VDVKKGLTVDVKDIRGISKEARTNDTIRAIYFTVPSRFVRVLERRIA